MARWQYYPKVEVAEEEQMRGREYRCGCLRPGVWERGKEEAANDGVVVLYTVRVLVRVRGEVRADEAAGWT